MIVERNRRFVLTVRWRDKTVEKWAFPYAPGNDESERKVSKMAEEKRASIPDGWAFNYVVNERLAMYFGRQCYIEVK